MLLGFNFQTKSVMKTQYARLSPFPLSQQVSQKKLLCISRIPLGDYVTFWGHSEQNTNILSTYFFVGLRIRLESYWFIYEVVFGNRQANYRENHRIYDLELVQIIFNWIALRKNVWKLTSRNFIRKLYLFSLSLI